MPNPTFKLWPALAPNEKVTHRGHVDMPDGTRYLIEAREVEGNPARGIVRHLEGECIPLAGSQRPLI